MNVSFSPGSGKAGSKVTIHGGHFVGATQVTFNGVSARFQVLNTGNIRALVPTGASTGPIAVTNAGGTSIGQLNFTVTP
jgi:IPT/TIG domain-containing protein